MPCHQSKEGNPDEPEDDTWMSHGLKGPWGPKPTPNLTHTENVPKGPHTSHQAKGGDERGPQGFGRTDLVSVNPGPPHGASLLVPKGIPGVREVFWRGDYGDPGL
jgi:hypothetical protein